MAARTHGEGSRGRITPEYRAWCGMNRRCHCPTNHAFKDYGGRGIHVADEWRGPEGYARFLAHVGRKPSPKHSIDRIDNDRGYEPGNVRWATMAEQQSNRRSTRKITFRGETMPLKDWAARIGINGASLAERIDRWGVERALTAPAHDRPSPEVGERCKRGHVGEYRSSNRGNGHTYRYCKGCHRERARRVHGYRGRGRVDDAGNDALRSAS